MTVEWGEPPPPYRCHWEAQLRANPGEWAIIGHYQSSAYRAANAYAWYVRNKKKPIGAYEAEHRVVDGAHRVYARYVGGDQ
jgi:hypothetical protein